MRFKLLGLLEVSDEGHVIPLPRGKERALLAALLIRANEPVSTDLLVDQLWEEQPPEHAAKTVQVYVSRLRKALGAERLETTPGGYVLGVADGELDSREFERLAREGRDALEARDLPRAERLLTEAASSWRGPALADFRFELFAQAEIRRLEEVRAGVKADLIDVRLERGQAGAVIAELEQLVSENALWERPRQQLMLALYRSGRQSEALDLYRRTRKTLGDELGIEPSPELQELERAILNQDPALAAPPRRVRLSATSRGAALLVAGGIILAVAAAAATFQLVRQGSASSAAASAGGTVVALDARTGRVERRLAAGTTPAAVALSQDSVWTVDADERTVLRIDAKTGAVQTLATGATPADVAADARSVWVANGEPLEHAQFVGPVATSVTRVEPAARGATVETRLPRTAGVVSNTVENRLAVGGGAVWTVTGDSGVARIDRGTGAITAVMRAMRVSAVAVGGGGVWVLGVDGTLARLNQRTAQPVARVRIPASSVSGIAVGTDAVWVTSASDGTLWRVSTEAKPRLGSIELDSGVADVAVGAGSVWVVNPLAGSLTQVDLARATVVRTVQLDGVPRSVAVAGDTVWVAVAGASSPAITGEVSGVRALPATMCDPVIAGGGDKADLLLVSDFPLQGGSRVTTVQMAQAIAYVLRGRGFRAGRFRLAYQSCDDSIATSGIYDEAKCKANARAYARNADVVAVIGTFNSGCALAALPELNTAPGGPLAMISPANSFVGLTRPGPGVPPDLPGSLYPTGHRNYVRVYPTDDLQGAALALFASDRGRKRVFVLEDGDPGYGGVMATGFETAARRLGLEVLGRVRWDPHASGYAALAQRVAKSGAEAVLVAGLLDTNAARVVRDLRARLPKSVDVLAPDGLTPLPLLVEQAGSSAFGAYVSQPGVVSEGLSAVGKEFVKRFGQTQPGLEIQPWAVYAAQATEVLLDAIARSDGTRPSIVQELFKTRVHNGLLGSFSFDSDGDTTQTPVSIVRVLRGGTSRAFGSVDGGVVARVVRPSPKLVAPEQ